METKDLKYIKAKHKVEKTKKFYTHFCIYIIVNLVITAFKVSHHLSSWESFVNKCLSIDVLSSWCIWGIILVFHFIKYSFGQGWEDRKIKTLMDKELSKKSQN